MPAEMRTHEPRSVIANVVVVDVPGTLRRRSTKAVVANVVSAVLSAWVDPVFVPESATPAIVPPVIATLLAFWAAIEPKPVMSLLGIVVEAVIALVPLPLT